MPFEITVSLSKETLRALSDLARALVGASRAIVSVSRTNGAAPIKPRAGGANGSRARSNR